MQDWSLEVCARDLRETPVVYVADPANALLFDGDPVAKRVADCPRATLTALPAAPLGILDDNPGDRELGAGRRPDVSPQPFRTID
jgi:hypothetical protein